MVLKKLSILFLLIISIFTLTSCEMVTLSSGESAYEIAVRNGFQGTEVEWLASLKGEKGDKGDSLKITEIYTEAQAQGFEGTFIEFLTNFADTDIVGESAYEVAVENGFTGTEEEWLASLKGERGSDGAPADTIDLYEVYEKLVELGLATSYPTYADFADYYITKLDIDVNTNANSVAGISKALKSAVKVVCSTVNYTTEEFQNSSSKYSTQISGQSGSGVIFKMNKEDGNAYIITNYHVVYNETSKDIMKYIFIYLYGNEYLDGAIEATFVGGSATYDIALIKVTDSDFIKNGICEACTVADSNNVVVGTKAIAIGNPAGEGLSVTEGIVSVDSETIEMSAIKDGVTLNEKGTVDMRVMRVDTAVNSGNSGGGLFNQDGELIGIVNAKIMSNDVENIGYAIPTSVAIAVANKIYEDCDGNTNTLFTRCLMGVTITIKSSKAVFVDGATRIQEEVIVHEVSETGIAYGKVLKDDIIKSLTIHGKTYDVTRNFIVIDACLQGKIGDTVSMVIERDGEELTVEMTFTTKIDIQ